MTGEVALAEGALGENPLARIRVPAIVAEAFDASATIISQYANSPILTQLIANIAEYIDPAAKLNAFYNLVWNVDTAVGYGLDVLGRIVGVNRVLRLPAAVPYLGFEQAAPTAYPFGEGIFYGGGNATTNYALSDAAFRRLVLAKAAANICDGSIPAINAILMALFPGYGNCYVTDGLDMTMTYTFTGPLSPVDLAIVAQSGVLPRPAGVSATIVQI